VEQQHGGVAAERDDLGVNRRKRMHVRWVQRGKRKKKEKKEEEEEEEKKKRKIGERGGEEENARLVR
jgi:hypothetical protein